MNNDFKKQLQEREFSSLKDEHRVILKWATGCGKSKMTIDLINNALDSYNKKVVTVLFLVAERAHIKNWEKEFDKWQLQRDKVSTDVACYASLKKYSSFYYDIIVLDEAHHIFTDKRMGLLQDMPKDLNQRVYLLSATLSSSKIDMAEEIFGKFTISTVTLKDAINSDILPDPKVYVVGMELKDGRPDQVIEARKGDYPNVVDWEHRNQYKFTKNPYSIRCNEKQKYLWFTNEMEYWKQRYERSKNNYHHNYWVNLGSQRKRFLGESKTEAVWRLLQSMPKSKRFVCFCASVAQAESLCAKDTVSSKKTAKRNQKIIDDFNAKKTNQIFAIGMITEGMNLNNIQVGIITQLDGKERLFVQKIGRVLRAESPVCIIFYYKNTQDENYLRGALENIDSKFVKHIDINQLTTIKL